MRFYARALVSACMIVATGQNALAQSTILAEPVDWSAQFAGLDGVAIKCIRTIERDYADRVCQQLIDHVASTLDKSGIRIVREGIFYSRDPAPEPSDELASPLNLTIHVRATDPNPLGMDIRVNASVSYTAAVESDGDTPPRRGELLMWQHGTTGAGTLSRLEPAIIQASKKRMDELLGHIKQGWPK